MLNVVVGNISYNQLKIVGSHSKTLNVAKYFAYLSYVLYVVA